MTEVAMVPLINSVTLVIVIKVTVFETRSTLGSLCDVSLIKKYLYGLFLLFGLKLRPYLLKDMH